MPFFVLLASSVSDENFGAAEDLSQAPFQEPVPTEYIPDDHPAYDRVQTREETDSTPRRLNRRVFVGVLLFLGALITAYYIAGPSGDGSGNAPDLLELAAERAEEIVLEIQTEDLDEAEDFILGEFGWPIRVPVLAGSRLVGVGVDEITEGVELPVMQYATAEREPVTVFVYDYAFLDAAAGRLSLSPAVYARLAEDDGVDVRRVNDYFVILWRRRAVLFMAATLEDPSEIVEGLRRGR